MLCGVGTICCQVEGWARLERDERDLQRCLGSILGMIRVERPLDTGTQPTPSVLRQLLVKYNNDHKNKSPCPTNMAEVCDNCLALKESKM